MSKLIVIVAITGTQGSSVADAYLKSSGWKIRGVVRNPDSEKAKAWAEKGVEIVKGNLNDLESLKAAFGGTDVIFGVTDFWSIWQDPENPKRNGPELEFLKYCSEVEFQQGKNLADAAATVSGLSRYVFSSMANVTESSGGKYTTLYHMDSKAKAATYAQSLPELAGKFSQIQAPIYYDILWKLGLMTTPRKQADGTWRLKGVGSSKIGVPIGDVRKDYGPCVKAVADAKPGLNVFANANSVSWSDMLKTFCETQGLKYGGVDELSYDQVVELIPGGLGHEFGLNVLFAFDFAYEGNDPTIIGPEKLGVKMTTWKEYCETTDFSAILE